MTESRAPGPIVIGLDLGTTSCKSVAVDSDGRLLASAASAYPLYASRPGWAEQDAVDVWNGARDALSQLAQHVPVRRVIGLCLSGAMHSLFPVDRQGTPLAQAMTWADCRAAPYVPLLRARTVPQSLYQRTGCPLRHTYHPARFRWWQEQSPQAFQHAAHFVAIKEWVLHRLTGTWAADLSMSSGTGLLDIRKLQWDEEALSLAGVSADRLLPLVPPEAVVSGLTRRASSETGLPTGLPVVAGAGDGATANLGAGAVMPGQVVVTVGTSGVIRRTVGSPWLDAEERTWCYFLVKGRWFAGGAVNNGGLALQWVRDNLYSDLPAETGLGTPSRSDGVGTPSRHDGVRTVLEEAASIAAGADGVVLLPYFTGERSPHWNADVRATIYGLSLSHTRAHVARAALEGVAYCLADVWAALHSELSEPARLTGGITRAPVWAQIVADVLGIPLRSMEAADASALGAAMLGHWALGGMKNLGDVQTPDSGRVFEPDPARHAFYSRQHRVFQSLYQSLSRLA